MTYAATRDLNLNIKDVSADAILFENFDHGGTTYGFKSNEFFYILPFSLHLYSSVYLSISLLRLSKDC